MNKIARKCYFLPLSEVGERRQNKGQHTEGTVEYVVE